MNIEKYLGMSKSAVLELGSDYIVNVNNVNGTVEVRDVDNVFGHDDNHAMLYFDLTNNSVMMMAILKIENVKLLDRIRLKLKGRFQYGEYIGCLTFHGKRDVIITYVRENIIKAL